MHRYKYKQSIKVLSCKLLVAAFLFAVTVLAAYGQENEMKGQILDEAGNPIQGAVINVSEQNKIVLSDEQGYFVLSKFVDDDEIIISKEGYFTKAIVVSEVKGKPVVMVSDGGKYNRYVNMPYQTLKSKHVAASTSTVYGAELQKHPVTVLQNAFMGSVTGVETYEFNSEPGWSTSELYIRGLHTTNSSARSPLVIIDNVERDLSFLDAFPVDNVTIIKDAAASAIYGMRGANGVIYVTTKRGEAGKTRINLTQEFGFQNIFRMPENQNSYNYALTINRALYLDGQQPRYSDEQIEYYRQACNGTLDPSLKYKYPNTNWRDEILRDLAPQNRTNLNVSGGGKAVRYFVSMTYLRQEGVYEEKWTTYYRDKYDSNAQNTQHALDRFNLRSNIDIDVNRSLNVSLDLGGRIDIVKQPRAATWDMFTWSAELHPNVPVFTPRGDFTQIMDNDYQTNPAARIAMSGIETNRTRNLYSNVRVTEKLDFITPGLSLKGLVGFDAYNQFQFYQNQNYDAFWYDADMDPEDPDAYTRRRTASPLSNPITNPRSMSYNVNTNFGVDYSRKFGAHDINAMAMVRTYLNVVPGFVSSTRYLTYTGILNYIYKDRYVLQGVATYMGSDNYQKGDRYGLFPGVSAGYILSEEDFIKNLNTFDILKLRASYGRAGQNNIGTRRYPFQSEYIEGGGYSLGTSQSGFSGAYESAAGNPNIKWELSDMANFGIDFDIWKGKVYGSFDWFKEWRSNILVTRSTVPDLYGVAVPADSYGKVETKGLEAVLGHKNNIKSFNYFIEGNITFNRNKIIDIDEVKPLYDYQSVTGRSIGQNLVYLFDKWFQSEAEIANSPYQGTGLLPGNAKFADVNNDSVINQYDMVPYGYSNIPEIVTGLRFGFEWKGMEARVLLVAQLNRSVYLRENTDHGFFWNANPTHEVVNTWGYYTDDPNDPRNINAKYPRLSTKAQANDRDYPRNQSTIWLKNGDLLSIRNVELGYSFPKKLIAKANLTQLRLYISGYNLYTFDHIKVLDPESPMSYIWQYPKTRTFSVGINIGL
jgi:TonB-linked SusC/RagA family outer membrane protein